MQRVAPSFPIPWITNNSFQKRHIYAWYALTEVLVITFRLFQGVDTDELESNAEEFEDEFVEFFIKEEIILIEE